MTLAELENAKTASLAEIAGADAASAESLRIKYVGRNGLIPALIKAMKDVPKEERPAFGKAVQAWKAEVDRKLNNDNDRLACMDEGSRVTQRAILALLDHGIDGNNIEQMQHAKEALQDHLINR
jgi:phenylalanyl-tRNA synthetase alpha chain